MSLRVIEQQRGPSMLLNLIFVSRAAKEKVIKEIDINNLAKVQIKLQHVSGDTFHGYLSSMKLDLEKNVTIKMNVSCGAPSFKKEWICTQNWSEWESVGVLEHAYFQHFNQYVCNLQININARKIEKPMLCTTMYLDADFIDFSLSTVNGIVGVHKIVMASHSDVFKAMLNGEWKETAEGQIALKGTTRETLEHLKDYMYLDVLPDEGLCPLLLIAVRYLIEDLKQRCIAKLTDTVTSENLYELLDFACENNIPELIYDILHLTPSVIIDSAYQTKKGVAKADTVLKVSDKN